MFAHNSRPVSIAAYLGSILVFALAACSGQSSFNPSASPQHHAARPLANAAPIQLVPGTTVGQVVFPEGDTATGGQGQQVDGINCRKALSSIYHHHVHLSLFVNGVQYAIPRGTGMKDPGTGKFIYHADCVYFLHTHDETGIIHIEPPTSKV